MLTSQQLLTAVYLLSLKSCSVSNTIWELQPKGFYWICDFLVLLREGIFMVLLGFVPGVGILSTLGCVNIQGFIRVLLDLQFSHFLPNVHSSPRLELSSVVCLLMPLYCRTLTFSFLFFCPAISSFYSFASVLAQQKHNK